MKIKITDDVFDIAWRLKEIDGAYEVFYNTDCRRYEVWADNRLQLVVPHKTLDARTVALVMETRVERLNKLMAEMEKHNTELAAREEKHLHDTASGKASELAKYLERKGTRTAAVPTFEEI